MLTTEQRREDKGKRVKRRRKLTPTGSMQAGERSLQKMQQQQRRERCHQEEYYRGYELQRPHAKHLAARLQ